MTRLMLAAACALAGCGSAPRTSDAAAAPTLVRVSLPDEPAAPWTGESGALIERNCVACHSQEMIANQPPLGAEKWAATIEKMRTVYKAQIAESDVAALVTALTAAQGAARR